MFCTQCGAELDKEDLFCGSCGKQRKDAPLRRPQGSGLVRLDERNIIALLGIESLSDERKISIVNRVNKLVQKKLLLRIMDFLDDEKTEEFERLVDSLDDVEAGEAGSKLSAFFQANVPMLDTWLIEEVNQVKEALVGVAEGADAELSDFKPDKT